MKHLTSLTIFVLGTLAHAAPVPIFDGKTLAGWEGDTKLWRVEDGCLTGGDGTTKISHNDFLCTKASYHNFVLRLKIKLTGDAATGMINSGVQIRTSRIPGQSEVSGYQCDYGDPTWWGAIYDEGRRNKLMAPSDMAAINPVLKRGDWNEYVIRAEGPHIQTWINGARGVDYTEAEANIAQEGILGVQVHSGGNAKVQIKDVTIEELPATPGAPTWDKIGRPGEKKPESKKEASNGGARTPEEERASFKVPEGYEVELVAAESEGVGKFVPLAFDQKGRLWTTTAFEYPVDGNENPPAADALYASKAKDKVLVFDTPFAKGPQTPRVFAEGLAIPLGVLPYKGGCYVQHGHDIAFLEDTDGDGKADKRTVVLTGFGVQDSHLFPHQFLRAPGGWIWMAQGAFNYGKVSQPGHEKEAQQFDQTRMAKFRPDGSDFTITSNGPCNIWGLVLNGEGEAFIQEANDYGYPVMPFHEYANYPGCSNGQWKSYAPEFPGTPGIPMGGTGLSGLALTDAKGPFTDAWRDVMLVANPITNRINAIKMHRDGPRWRLEKLPDFIESSDSWFRPIAITIGPDGCLYIVDWYNKIISHNEVARNHPDRDKTRGRIWRVKAKAMPAFAVPDFTKATGEELLAKLGGDSLAQSHLAWQAIIDRDMKELGPKLREIVAGEVGVAHAPPRVVSSAPPENAADTGAARQPGEAPGTTREARALPARRIAALWALEGLDGLQPERKMLEELLDSPDRNIRREAMRLVPTLPMMPKKMAFVIEDLKTSTDPEVRAELIRVCGQLFGGAVGEPREFELYGKMALWKLLSQPLEPLAEPMDKSTQSGKPIKVREAYDREFERYLVRMFLEKHPEAVAKFLDSDDAKKLPIEARLLASLALEPKASATRVAALLPLLTRAPGQEEVLRLAQFPGEPGVGDALKAVLNNPATRTAALESLLAVRTKLDAAKLSPFLADAAATMLASKDAASIELGVKLASGYKLAGTESALVAFVRGSAGTAVPLSLAALRALAEMGSTQTELFASLATTATDHALRDEALAALAASKAADAPARVLALYPKLTPAQRRAVLDKLTTSKPGATAVVAALTSGAMAKTDLDAATLDRLQAVLGTSDPVLNALVDSLGALFRPVLVLDGSEEAWVETGLSFDGPLTVETWVQLAPGINNTDGILGVPGVLDMNFFDSKFRVFAGPKVADAIVSKKPIIADLWTHLAAVRDAEGRWKLYTNGELDNADSKPAPGRLENVRIGWTGAGGGTSAAFAEYRLWDHARTADEIRRDFDRSLGGATFLSPSAAEQPATARTATGMSPLLVSGKLHAGAKIVKTSDLPPVLTAEEATALDAKFSKFRALISHPGDAARGKPFAAVCMACHLFGTTGGNIGPNLSAVGAMGPESILRNILTPNAAMENGYRIFRVELKSGDLVDALFVSEDKDAVVIRLPGAEDRRIPRSEIRATSYQRRSLMPEGLLDGFTPEQASDLFAYLLSLK